MLNLSELIHEVWKDERIRDAQLRKGEVKIVVEVVIDHIVKSLLDYGKIKLKGLFTLNVKKVKARRIRNPQTKELMYTKEYHKVTLEPSKRLKDGLEKLDNDMTGD